jgi:hypothetical protein
MLIQKLLKFITPRLILVLAILGLIATILSIAGRIYLKGMLPDFLTNYNTQGYSMLFLLGTIGLISIFFLMLKVKVWIKLLCIPISWILVFFLSTWIGHSMNDSFTTLYYNSHKDTFQELIITARNDSVCFIANSFSRTDLKITDCNKNEIENAEIKKIAKKLGFRQYRGILNVMITYEFSMWGGYGFYFSHEKKEKPQTLGPGGETQKWLRLDENVYYFTYN